MNDGTIECPLVVNICNDKIYWILLTLYYTIGIYPYISYMTTSTTVKNKFNILKTYGNELVISINKDLWNKLYSEYTENNEMNDNKVKLTKKYQKSLESWFWLKI